jgi:hypothetical protein
MSDPTDAAEAPLPPSLRFLKALVIVLMLTMIGGVITVVALLVTRMPAALSGGPDLPDGLALPAGAEPQAVTFGQGWIAVVTTDDRILIFGRDGQLRQDIALPPGTTDGT